MDERERTLAQAIVKDWAEIMEAAKRLESRIYQYSWYARNEQALCNAEDESFEIVRHAKMLEDALDVMLQGGILQGG